MPNASGFITVREAREMIALRLALAPTPVIARMIGCHETTVSRHAPNCDGLRQRAERYAAFVHRASAYVPTIGGARG